MSVTIVSVRELVVSAGKNVEVTLPRSEVELNAFVVPEPPSGTALNKPLLLASSPLSLL